MVKNRVSLLTRMHALFVRNGIGIKKGKLTGRPGFERAVARHEWHGDEKLEIDVIRKQAGGLLEDCRRLEKRNTAVARTLPGYANIIGIKGIGPLYAAVFPCTICDISRCGEPGNLAAYFSITPRVSQSSNSRRVERITRWGGRVARTATVQCALVAIRYSSYLTFHEKIRAGSGTGKVIIATAGKHLNGIFRTLKNGRIIEDFTTFTQTAAWNQSWEKGFSQMKSHLRKVAANSKAKLRRVSASAIDLVTPEISVKYYTSCGYQGV